MNRATYVIASLGRKPVRLMLTWLSLVIAFLLFMLLRAIATALTGGVSVSEVQRVIVDAKYSMTDNLPMAHIQAIGRLPGVQDITPSVWFGGYYQDPKQTFTTLPVDQARYFKVYPEVEIEPDVLERFRHTRYAVVAHESLATEYGWTVGQSLPMMGDIWPREDGSRGWDFLFAGSYQTPPGSRIPKALLLRHDYFNESVTDWVKDQVGWAVVRVDAGTDAQTVIRAIDGLFENSSDPTKSMSESAYAEEMANEIGDLGLIASMILGAVFFTLVLLTTNVVSLGFRERIAEFATLKSLGFRDSAVFNLVLTESLALCIVGAGCGVVLALLIEPVLAPQLEQVMSGVRMTWLHSAQAMSIAVVLGTAVGILPALRARRLPIAQALREAGE